MNESTPATLAYGLGGTGSEFKVMFTISVEAHLMYLFISIEEGHLEVLATAKDTPSLHGREYFDNRRVIDYMVKVYDKKTGGDVISNQRAMKQNEEAKSMICLILTPYS